MRVAVFGRGGDANGARPVVETAPELRANNAVLVTAPGGAVTAPSGQFNNLGVLWVPVARPMGL
jgi:hypothetical protein